MKKLAENKAWAIYSSVGSSIKEGTVEGKADAAGPEIVFKLDDKLSEYNSVVVKVEASPVSAQSADGLFWDFYSGKKGGSVSAYDFSFGYPDFQWGDGTFKLTLNSDNVAESDVTLRITVWENLEDSWSGSQPLLSTSFKVIDDDKITGTSGNDKMIGSGIHDLIYGYSGNDFISANGGNDLVYAGAGNDTVGGGTGNDSLYAEDGNDRLFGREGHDYLSGGNGNDIIYGGSGNDVALGGAGNDTIAGETGNDRLDGGDGNDRLVGGAGNDRLNGGDGNDKLYGGTGNDKLYGDAGNDVIYGDAGADNLYGGYGNDALIAGAGNDRLFGGSGNDSLRGGAGADAFIFYGNDGRDVIRDFEDKRDKIYIISNDVAWDFDDLRIYQSGNNAVVKFESTTVIIQDTKASLITQADFKVWDEWEDPFNPFI